MSEFFYAEKDLANTLKIQALRLSSSGREGPGTIKKLSKQV